MSKPSLHGTLRQMPSSRHYYLAVFSLASVMVKVALQQAIKLPGLFLILRKSDKQVNTDTLAVSNITIVTDSCSCCCPKQHGPLWQRLVGRTALLGAGSRCSRTPGGAPGRRQCLSDPEMPRSLLGGWLPSSGGLLAGATCHGGISSQDAVLTVGAFPATPTLAAVTAIL